MNQAFKIPSLFEVRCVAQHNGCERPHTHDSLIVTAVASGHIDFQINAHQVELSKGLLVAVGRNTLHCIRSHAQTASKIYVLEIFGLPTQGVAFDTLHVNMFKSRVFENTQEHRMFVNLCQSLLGPLDIDQKVEIYAEWLNCFLSKCYAHTDVRHIQNNALAEKIKGTLDAHLSDNLAFEEIAHRLSYSQAHCNRVFKQVYNVSMQAYFLNQKAERARDLLISNKTLSEIALESGFYDQSHFNRIFKEIFQVTPKQYRQIICTPHQSHTINA